MRDYIIKRLLWFIPVLFVTVTLLFFLIQVIPGDPIRAAFGDESPLSEEQAADLRTELGLDKSIPERYFKWLWDILHLDLGISFYTGSTVKEQILARIPITVGLVTLSVLTMLIMSVPCGVIAGYYHDRWPDWILRTTSIMMISLPHFWVAIMAILVMLTLRGYSISIEYINIFVDPLGAIQQLAIPAFIMALRPFGVGTRMVRSAILEIMEEDFIRTARSKGLVERIVTRRHALPNALVPVVTFYGLETIIAIGAAVVMEGIFGIPGIGSLVADAASTRDLYVLQGSILMLLLFAMFVNLMIDLLCARLDPRIRYENE
ncbi:ABC transporter permease [Thermodesulfobacteriota bacterium]